MVLYNVSWFHESELSKGKGRVKNGESIIQFTVLCRCAGDALRCLDYHFRFVYENSNNLTINDGEIKLKRCVIDSRGFQANYLMMDGIREPLVLVDLKSNALRAHKIFGLIK